MKANNKRQAVEAAYTEQGLTLTQISAKGGYICNVDGVKNKIANLDTAINFIEEYKAKKIEENMSATATAPVQPKVVVEQVECAPCLSFEAQTCQLLIDALLIDLSMIVENAAQTTVDEAEYIYTTASTLNDIPEITLESIDINLMSGSKRRWRMVKSLDAARQYDAYKTAKCSVVRADEWEKVKGFQIKLDNSLEATLGGAIAKVKLEKEKVERTAPVVVSEVLGKNGKPKAVNADGEYKAGLQVKTVREGSKIDTIIKMLTDGATIEALSEAVGKKMSASYVAQRLALRGYGLRKVVDDIYQLVIP